MKKAANDIIDAALIAFFLAIGVIMVAYDRARNAVRSADQRAFFDDDGWCVA